MARRPLLTVKRDFDAVVEHLRDRHLIPSAPSEDLLRVVRSIHESSYSLIIWRYRLKRNKENAHVFLGEIASDALQIIPQVVLGYGKTTKLLIRSVLENTLRHVYFSDHPIEYRRMNAEAKWYITMEQLSDYMKNHPSFSSIDLYAIAVGEVMSMYSELSAGVHGRRRQDLEMRDTLKSLVYSEKCGLHYAELFRRCTQNANFLLSIFNKDQMKKFPLEDKRAILHTMPAKYRQAWIQFEWS